MSSFDYLDWPALTFNKKNNIKALKATLSPHILRKNSIHNQSEKKGFWASNKTPLDIYNSLEGWYEETMFNYIPVIQGSKDEHYQYKISAQQYRNHWYTTIHVQPKNQPKNTRSFKFCSMAQHYERSIIEGTKTAVTDHIANNQSNITSKDFDPSFSHNNLIKNKERCEFKGMDCGPMTLELIKIVMRDPASIYTCNDKDSFDAYIKDKLKLDGTPEKSDTQGQIFRNKHVGELLNCLTELGKNTVAKKLNLITICFFVALLSTLALVGSCFVIGLTNINFLPYLATVTLNHFLFSLNRSFLDAKANEDFIKMLQDSTKTPTDTVTTTSFQNGVELPAHTGSKQIGAEVRTNSNPQGQEPSLV